MGNLQFGRKWVSLSTAKNGVILKSIGLSGDADISNCYQAVHYCELHIHNPKNNSSVSGEYNTDLQGFPVKNTKIRLVCFKLFGVQPITDR